MRLSVIILAAALFAAPAMAQRAGAGLTIEERAEQQVWIDQHARWNAEHMAAARRLAEIAATLKGHNSNFDSHGSRLRGHSAATAGQSRVTAATAQARLRAAHEEARSAHHHLMADVDALYAVMGDKFEAPPQ